MIYLFHGSDVEKVSAKAFEWVSKAREKEPNVTYIRVAREELTPNLFEDIAAAHSLFAKRTLTLLDDPYSESESPLDECLDLLAESENVVVILSPKLVATKVKKIAPKAKAVYSYDLHTREFVRGFNSNLVNALGVKNREKLWLEIVRALRQGDAPEMLHGLLHWKARDLMEKGSREWTKDETRALSLSLISLVQHSRRGGLPLDAALEKYALEV